MSDIRSIFKVLVRLGHSHSIVSGTCNQLKRLNFLSGCAGLTVKSTARKFRLKEIDGDRCRNPCACFTLGTFLAHFKQISVAIFDRERNGDVGRALRSSDHAISDVAGELGEVLTGTKNGRCSPIDITIAKLVGLGAQDLVAAEVSLERLHIGRDRPAKGIREAFVEAAV
jgi:hypothetical protein